jgi:amino acid transporter
MHPPRALGLLDLILYGAALTFTIRWIATAAAAGPASLMIWIIAALGFLAPLCIASAELAGRFPGEGGIYAWSRDVLGPFWGFICGWLYWASNLPFFAGVIFFAINVAALALGEGAQRLVENEGALFALACVVALIPAGLHALGLGVGKWLPAFGVLCSFALLFLLIALALMLRDSPATDFAAASYAPPINANGAILWATMVFAFGGAEAVTLLRHEVKGGMPQIIRALLAIALVLVTAYGLGTLALLTIIPAEEATRLGGLPEAIKAGLERVGAGQLAAPALLLLAAASIGSYSAWFGVAARLPLAVGVDKLLPAAFGHRDPRTGAPHAAIILQTALVLALVALSRSGENMAGAYDFVIAMSTISYTFPFLFLFIAFLVAQGRPASANAWTAPGGRRGALAIGWTGCLISLSAILCSMVPSPDAADQLGATVKLFVATTVMIGAGVAIYSFGRLRARGTTTSGPP